MSDLTGNVVGGRYRLDEFRGQGSMAVVYKAWDLERGVFRAMKVLHKDFAEDQDFVRRFRRETQTLAGLKHPNIVRFYELGQEGELVFMLLEYVDGMPLSKARTRWRSAITSAQVLTIIQPVCSALQYAHQLDQSHGDIKPANILLDRAGLVLLADYGIARVSQGAATAAMTGAGTAAYMSPEQIVGEDPSPQSDIYSLGVVLYELLTGGERPFTGEHATITGTVDDRIRWEKRNVPPTSPRAYSPSLSVELEGVVLRCLERDRRERYSSVDELSDSLTAAVGVSPELLPTGALSRDDKRVQYAIRPVPVAPPPPVQTAPLTHPPATRAAVVAAPVPVAAPSPKPPRRGLWNAVGAFAVVGILATALVVGGSGFLRSRGILVGSPPADAQSSAAASNVKQSLAPVPVETQTSQPTLQPTAAQPTATVLPSETPTPVVSHVTGTQEHDKGGYFLVAQGGPQNIDLRYGPISNGAFVLADNDKFAAYVDINGVVYIMNYRMNVPTPIKKYTRRDLKALASNSTPNFALSLATNSDNAYILTIHEKDFGDTLYLTIPKALSE